MFLIILRCSSSEMNFRIILPRLKKKSIFGIWYYCGNRKTKQMRTNRGYLFRDFYSMGISGHHLHFGRHSKAGRGVWKLYSGKRVRLQVALIEAVGMGKVKMDALEEGPPLLGRVSGFLWLVLSCKWGRQLGKLLVIIIKSGPFWANCYRNH